MFFLGISSLLSPASALMSQSRYLATVDVINALLADFQFEIDLGEDIEIPLYTIQPVVCDGFAFSDMTVTSVIDDASVPEENAVAISLSGLQFNCAIELEGSTFLTPDISTFIRSADTSISIPLIFTSTEFGEVIPTTGDIDPSAECVPDIISIDIEIGNPILDGIIDVESIAESEFCPLLEELLPELTAILSDNVLIDIAGVRVEQPESFLAAVEEAEASIDLPVNFSFYDADEIDSITDSFLTNIMAAPLVEEVAFIGLQFIGAVQAENAELAEELLEELLFVLLEQEVDVPSEVVEFIISSGILDDILEGDFSFEEILVALLDLFDFDLPSVEEVEAFFDSLPAALSPILEPIETFIIELLESLGTSRRLQDISDIISLLPEDSPLIDLLTEVEDLDQLISTITSLTVADILEMTALPPNSSIEDFLLSFGADTTLEQLFNYLADLFARVSTDFSSLSGEFVDVTDPLPASFLEVLELSSSAVPELQPLLDNINAFNGSLAGLLENFTVEVPLGDFGNVSLGIASLGLSVDFDLDTSDFGAIEESSLALPLVNLSSLYVEIGLSLSLFDAETVFADDVLLLAVDFGFDTQEALTFGFAVDNLVNFEFFRLTSLPTALDVLLDYFLCGLSSVGGTLSAQKTRSEFTFTLESVNGDFSGLVEEFANVFVGMYAPAVPTLLENTLYDLTQDLPFFSLEMTESCYANHASSKPEEEDEDDDDDDEGDDGDDTGTTPEEPTPETEPSGALFGDGVSGFAVIGGAAAFAAVLLALVSYNLLKKTKTAAAPGGALGPKQDGDNGEDTKEALSL